MSEICEVQTIVDTAIATTEPTQLVEGQDYAFVVPAGGTVERIDNDLDVFRPRPRRKTGQVQLSDAASFAAYYRKHAEEEGASELYASLSSHSCVGVLNGHSDDVPGWGDHRVVLQLRKTPAWTAWEALDRKLVDQVRFAEHIEDRLADCVDPPGAAMLELAQSFHAQTKVSFESSRRLSSGQRQLEYREEVNASAGRKGQITIPETFALGLIPFEGGGPYRVEARLRYRMTDGHLAIGYALTRPEDVLREAFGDAVAAIEATLGIKALMGAPG